MFVGDTPVSWESRVQKTVARSTAESEYMALSSSMGEVVHMTRLLKELGYFTEGETGTVRVLEDNTAAIHIANGRGRHSRTKHIDVHHHFVREKLVDGGIELDHCALR